MLVAQTPRSRPPSGRGRRSQPPEAHHHLDIPVSVNKMYPFMRAFALQHGSRSCSPATDLVLFKLIVLRVVFSGGVICSQTLVSFWRDRDQVFVALARRELLRFGCEAQKCTSKGI